MNQEEREALMEQASHTYRSLLPRERMTVLREAYKNSKAGVGNGQADGPFSNRRDGPECN